MTARPDLNSLSGLLKVGFEVALLVVKAVVIIAAGSGLLFLVIYGVAGAYFALRFFYRELRDKIKDEARLRDPDRWG